MADAKLLRAQLSALLTGFWLTDLANFCAFLFYNIPDLNWVGFYISNGEKLRLGPFAGKPACAEIAFDRGVCGATFTSKSTVRVSDVYEFPGHISCDSASRSEIVLPLTIQGRLVGVLDIDSPILARFSEEDQEFFERALGSLADKIADSWGTVPGAAMPIIEHQY